MKVYKYITGIRLRQITCSPMVKGAIKRDSAIRIKMFLKSAIQRSAWTNTNLLMCWDRAVKNVFVRLLNYFQSCSRMSSSLGEIWDLILLVNFHSFLNFWPIRCKGWPQSSDLFLRFWPIRIKTRPRGLFLLAACWGRVLAIGHLLGPGLQHLFPLLYQDLV